jgi:TonB-dependent receptor
VNYDLGFEYYTRHTGLFSVNLYHKAIDKFIYSSRSERAGSIETVDGMPVPVSEPQNGARATIDGVEVTLQRQFRFLPSPWDGLGVNLNYTFQKSEAETNLAWRAGRKTDFLNAPHRLWNLAFYYEKYGFEARLAASFNDKYIEDLRNYGHDKWVLARTMLDLKLGYRLVRGWKLSIEGHNLNNEHVYWASHGPSGAFQKDYTRTGTYWIFAANWNY